MIPTLPVMEELPADKRRRDPPDDKGNFLDPGDTVEPGVPAALHPLPEGAPATTAWAWPAGWSIPRTR